MRPPPATRQAVAQANLEHEGLTVVGTTKAIVEALAKVDELGPDVVLVNIATC